MTAHTARELALHAIAHEHAAQKPAELAALAEWLAARPAPDYVLEVGVFLAGTAWLWRALWPDATLVGLDLAPAKCPPCDARRAHRDCPRRRLRETGMRVVVADSLEPATLELVRAELAGGAVGFLHVDGDHTYEGVASDFHAYASLVRSGGAVALHDVAGEAYPGCVRFWRELEADAALPTFLLHEPADDWGGIGVVVMP